MSQIPADASASEAPQPKREKMDDVAAAKAALLAEAAKPDGPSAADKAAALVREKPFVILAAAALLGGIIGYNKSARHIISMGAALGLKKIVSKAIAGKLR